MTLKEKLAKAKLVNKYTIERDFYIEAMRKGNTDYVDFYTLKAVEFQSKINELEESA
jgi:predicted aldo/keto reductase-like oxidoreductase|tara:strand:- start:33 stop:203 length:171 start_codon:yes stop_codon:yes gene_type:complete